MQPGRSGPRCGRRPEDADRLRQLGADVSVRLPQVVQALRQGLPPPERQALEALSALRDAAAAQASQATRTPDWPMPTVLQDEMLHMGPMQWAGDTAARLCRQAQR